MRRLLAFFLRFFFIVFHEISAEEPTMWANVKRARFVLLRWKGFVLCNSKCAVKTLAAGFAVKGHFSHVLENHHFCQRVILFLKRCHPHHTCQVLECFTYQSSFKKRPKVDTILQSYNENWRPSQWKETRLIPFGLALFDFFLCNHFYHGVYCIWLDVFSR